MKVYRESSMGGVDGQRALDVMRRLTEANSKLPAMCQIITAIHDAEATAETLQSSVTEAEESGILVPETLKKMCKARHLLELSAEHRWSDLLHTLQGPAVSDLFYKDPEGLAEFQYYTVKTGITKFLNQEIVVPGAEADKAKADGTGNAAPLTAEKKAQQEKDLKDASLVATLFQS